MLKKQALTKQVIQKELLSKINKRKALSVWLTAFLFIAIICYVIYLVAYTNGGHTDKFFVVSITTPFILLFFTVFLLDYYYINLYKSKKGLFNITEEKLCEKEKELVRYYRRTEKENSLYFSCGRVAVPDDVYSYSDVGDLFYIIVLRSKRAPLLVYNKKFYEI